MRAVKEKYKVFKTCNYSVRWVKIWGRVTSRKKNGERLKVIKKITLTVLYATSCPFSFLGQE